MKNAIEIKNLSKTLEDFTLNNISLTLPCGCVMGLVGENGAGKSTTMRLILDIIRKDSGTIEILGKNNEDNIKLTKEDVGIVMDNMGFPECLTAKQVGNVMSSTYKNWDGAEFKRLIKTLAVPENKQFKDLSRGMKMKLGIAVALSHNAKLLLLDEPTSGLDPVVRDEVVDIFNEFTRDESHSILISSHIVSDLEKLCDYIAFIHKGELLLCEEKDMLLSEYGIVQCTTAQLSDISKDAVVRKKESQYGVEALVYRSKVPSSMRIIPVSIEELFVFIVKGAA